MSQNPSNGLRDLIYPYYKTFSGHVLSRAILLLLMIRKSELSRVYVTDFYLLSTYLLLE